MRGQIEPAQRLHIAARSVAQEAGLAVSCLTSSGPLPLGDPGTEAAALARVRGHLEAAARLGAACLMVLPGNVPALAWEEAAEQARPLLRALLPDAERAGVRLAVEPRAGIVGLQLHNADGTPQLSSGPFPTLAGTLAR